MSPTIRIDDEVFTKLKGMGEAFVDTPNSVLRRVLGLEGGAANVVKQELGPLDSEPDTNYCASEMPSKTHKKENAEMPSKQITSYFHPRLCFKSSYIEPLNDGDEFQVETAREGTFRFTKAEFYRIFPNVVKSISYRENGIYHYPVVPRKALAYRVALD